MSRTPASAQRPRPGGRSVSGARRGRDPALDADAAALHRVLSELKRVYQFRDRDRICCYDISVTQCWALNALVGAGSLTLNQLAAKLYLDKSTTSRVVKALERKGYVQRTRHPEDGRAVVLRATAAGARLQTRIEREMLEMERGLLSEFDDEVRRSMVQLIGRLLDAAGARLEAGGGKCCVVEPPG